MPYWSPAKAPFPLRPASSARCLLGRKVRPTCAVHGALRSSRRQDNECSRDGDYTIPE
jgi:hypothetical protein